VCTAVQNSDDLAVSFDGHPRDRAFGGQFEVFDPHLLGEFTATVRETLLQFRMEVVEYAHVDVLPSVLLGRLNP
jgi:hypothetical protein